MCSGETVCDLGIDLYNSGWAAFAPSGPALAERLADITRRDLLAAAQDLLVHGMPEHAFRRAEHGVEERADAQLVLHPAQVALAKTGPL